LHVVGAHVVRFRGLMFVRFVRDDFLFVFEFGGELLEASEVVDDLRCVRIEFSAGDPR
jgi:hypothetical protein